MIVHQAPCMEFCAVLLYAPLQKCKKCRAVGCIFKNDALSDTPIHYMVDVRFTLNSRLSWHVVSSHDVGAVPFAMNKQDSYIENAIMYSNHF